MSRLVLGPRQVTVLGVLLDDTPRNCHDTASILDLSNDQVRSAVKGLFARHLVRVAGESSRYGREWQITGSGKTAYRLAITRTAAP